MLVESNCGNFFMSTRKAKSKQTNMNSHARSKKELVIITGMSGSGKASALKAFEDMGYYCVDNLPVELIPRFTELIRQSEHERTALVVDIREGALIQQIPAILKSLRKQVHTKVVFLEASDVALM